MLSGPELGKAIDEAITLKGVSKADVARHFKVKPPSVSDWVKRGTVAKKHLPGLWDYFRDVVGPEHWGLSELPANGRGKEPKGAFLQKLTPEEHELVGHWRHLLGKDRRHFFDQIAALAKEREEEREEMLAEAGLDRIAQNAAHAARGVKAKTEVEADDRLKQRSLLDDK